MIKIKKWMHRHNNVCVSASVINSDIYKNLSLFVY